MWRDRVYEYTPRYTLFNQALGFRSAWLYRYYRHIMQEESGSIEVKSIYKFAWFAIPGPSCFLYAVYGTVHLR